MAVPQIAASGRVALLTPLGAVASLSAQPIPGQVVRARIAEEDCFAIAVKALGRAATRFLYSRAKKLYLGGSSSIFANGGAVVVGSGAELHLRVIRLCNAFAPAGAECLGIEGDEAIACARDTVNGHHETPFLVSFKDWAYFEPRDMARLLIAAWQLVHVDSNGNETTILDVAVEPAQ